MFPPRAASASPAKCNEPVRRMGFGLARANSNASEIDEVMECWSNGVMVEKICASVSGFVARWLRILGSTT